MVAKTVRYQTRRRVAVITIERADVRNAINDQVVEELNSAWRRFEEGDDRVAILLGAGDRAFSAGADLSDPPSDLWKCVPGIGADVSKPTIAAVSGWCVGAGLVLADACDLVVATDDAKFLYPEAYVGMTGGLISGLADHLPRKRAMEIILLGEPISASHAAEIGLVNRVVPAGRHLAEATKIAARIATAAPLVVRFLKQVTQASRGQSEVNSARIASRQLDEALGEIARSDDRAEGRRSFRERRQPKFRGH